MKEQPRAKVRHFRNSNLKHKMKRLQVWEKLAHEKIYVQEIAAVILSKIYLLKNAKNRCKSNNRDVNRDWITFSLVFKNFEHFKGHWLNSVLRTFLLVKHYFLVSDNITRVNLNQCCSFKRAKLSWIKFKKTYSYSRDSNQFLSRWCVGFHYYENIFNRSLYLISAKVQFVLVTCRGFLMMRIFYNGIGWKQDLTHFYWSNKLQKEFLINIFWNLFHLFF